MFLYTEIVDKSDSIIIMGYLLNFTKIIILKLQLK